MAKKRNVKTIKGPFDTPVLTAWFDGCCEPKNPGGHGSYGVVIKRGLRGDENDETIFEESGYCGFGGHISNNVAEYSGALRILEYIRDRPEFCTIYGDSKLVVMQLQGYWRAKGGLYLPYFEKAKTMFDEVKRRTQIIWIPREKNAMCDALSKDILIQKGIHFKIQPN